MRRFLTQRSGSIERHELGMDMRLTAMLGLLKRGQRASACMD